MGRKKSAYDPYYSRIQGLLFDGMSIENVHKYMKKYFQINEPLEDFCKYIIRKKLYWFMPGVVTAKQIRRKYTDHTMEMCKYPDCFHCTFPDCVNSSMEKELPPHELYELSKVK